MAWDVTDNAAESRFEVRNEGELAAYVTYTQTADTISFNHTEGLPAFAGQGAARVLVTAALDQAREQGLNVIPVCPFVAAVIKRNAADYLDLVPVARRAEFGLPSD